MKPELLNFNETLMINPMFDKRAMFAPEIEYYKNYNPNHPNLGVI